MPLALIDSRGTPPSYPSFVDALPDVRLEHGRYRASFARNEDQLDALLRLRFEVFNREMAEGLEESWTTGRDEDRFDRACHHLLVEDRVTGATVGTYRMQTGVMAAAGQGFYSAGEYDLSALPEAVRDDAVEVGRACIAREHRNRAVLFLLWQGLAAYMVKSGKRFLFGCSSITSQDPAVAVAAYRELERRGVIHPQLVVGALPGFIAEPLAGDEPLPEVEIPSLFRTYLRYGGKVVSPPAIDREFKTIDFLILFDTAALDERSRRLFFGA